MNKSDIDFENNEFVVLGKGSKQRKAYFDERTKLHLLEYLETRNDSDEALFVSKIEPHIRISENGLQRMIARLGKKAGLNHIHPHNFRRTMATKAIDKGMPIEQVQTLLGHAQISTTLRYAIVSQSNVKISHKKYIG